jgi:ubiquinone/menaquinone biosynthesis C-methylase UbiE
MDNSIREHWNRVAEKWGDDPSGAMPDRNLRGLEFALALKFLNPTDSILDLGCGNGKVTIELAKRVAGPVCGIDFAQRMIAHAQSALNGETEDIRRRVRFENADAATFKTEDQFAKIYAFRCLINIPEKPRQSEVIANISRWLKPGGYAFLSESTIQGFSALNPVRESLGLPPVRIREHNTPIDEEFIRAQCQYRGLELEVIDYSSTYYLVSRCLNIKFAETVQASVEFFPEIDNIAASLPSVGNFGLLRMLKIRKP